MGGVWGRREWVCPPPRRTLRWEDGGHLRVSHVLVDASEGSTSRQCRSARTKPQHACSHGLTTHAKPDRKLEARADPVGPLLGRARPPRSVCHKPPRRAPAGRNRAKARKTDLCKTVGARACALGPPNGEEPELGGGRFTLRGVRRPSPAFCRGWPCVELHVQLHVRSGGPACGPVLMLAGKTSAGPSVHEPPAS